MIEVKNLKKSYGSFKALHGISFTVERGHIYGFLGPNGAGKSTTMNIICGCLAASEGSVTINGHDIFSDPIEAKRCIGYLPEQPPLYLDMKVDEYLDFVGRAKGLRGVDLDSQIKEVVEMTGLENVRRRLIKNLSKGYKQRVGIAQAVLGNPEVIILDEPTVGLDPIQIIEIRELIKSLAYSHTVILSSHILTEISAVCDRIIIIAGGRIVANNTIEGLMDKYKEKTELDIICKASMEKVRGAISTISGVKVEISDSDEPGALCLHLVYEGDRASFDIREAAWRALCGAGIVVLSMIPKVTTLEDEFIALTTQTTESVDEDESDVVTSHHVDKSTNGKDDDAEDNDSDDSDDDSEGDDYKPLFS